MDDELIAKTRGDMDAVIEVVTEDIATVKTGRAKPSLVENIKVEIYATKMALLELASISAPDPHMLIIQPWDESALENIEKAISKSEMGLNPVVDGSVVRIQIPPLTEERREEYIKLLKQKLESGRVMLRQARQEGKKKIESLKGQPGVSEDDVHRLMEELEKLTDEYMKKVEELGKVKEEELRRI